MFDFLKRKKQKKQAELDASFAKVMSEIQRIDDTENPQRIQHYILDSCEQIIATTKEIDKERRECRVLDDYLGDVQKLTGLNERQKKLLRDVVKNLREAEKARDDYAHIRHRLNDDLYAMMERNEAFAVDDIRQMQQNEVQQSKVRRDMQMLEATKSEYEIEREHIAARRTLLRQGIIGVFIGGMSLCVLFMLLHYAIGFDMTLGFLLLFLGIAIFMLYLFYANASLTRANKQALNGLNKTISLLNVVRMKYANVTASLQFTQGKYKVQSAHELNWIWDSYMEESRIRKKNEQDNEDFRYFYGRLIKILNDLELHDRKLWMDQLGALEDDAQLNKVRAKLMRERQRVETQIEENTRIVRSERDEVSRLMRENDYYPPEIVEIISSVDRMCGLNTAYKVVR